MTTSERPTSDAGPFHIRELGEIEGLDIPYGLILEGDINAVRAAGKFFGEKIYLASDTAPSPKGPAPVVGEAKSWTDAGLRTLQSALDLELLAEAISNCRWASIIPDKAAEQLKAAADFLASAPITAAPQEAQDVSEAPSPKGVSDGVRAESDIGGWKPIATAPRDGSLVWLWNKHAKHAVDSPQRFWWSTHYSVFGLGGCWTDGLATMGDKIDFDYWREELPANFINPYAALSQEPVPATAEERAASKEGA